MTPTHGHLHHVSRTARRGERHIERRVVRHLVVDRRMKAWPRRERLTLAESPELYMREEMI